MLTYYEVKVETFKDGSCSAEKIDQDVFVIKSDKEIREYLRELWGKNKNTHLFGSVHLDHSKPNLPHSRKVFISDFFKRIEQSDSASILHKKKNGNLDTIYIEKINIRERNDKRPKHKIGDTWFIKRRGVKIKISWHSKTLVSVSILYKKSSIHTHKWSVRQAINWASNEVYKNKRC